MSTDREELLDQANAYSAGVIRHQDQRDDHVRGALAAGAAYLTLMTAAVAKQGTPPIQLRSAQFLLSLFFAAVLAYYIMAAVQHASAIVDDAARRLFFERRHGVPPIEDLNYTLGARDWRKHPRWPRWLLASLPRAGRSQQIAVLVFGVSAMLPAAWFALSRPRDPTLDLAIIACTAVLLLLDLRLLFVGCRHWYWVDPVDFRLRRNPFEDAAPAWRWRLELFRQSHADSEESPTPEHRGSIEEQ